MSKQRVTREQRELQAARAQRDKHASAGALQAAAGDPVLIRPWIASVKQIALTATIATISRRTRDDFTHTLPFSALGADPLQ